jgi:DNA-binding PadR family transcriptional regulator
MRHAAFRQSRNVVALTVLALLHEGPLHAYGMQTLIRERHKAFAAGNPRALYHAVERLAGAGLIEPAETERVGRRPERTVYRITEAGRDELEAWLTHLLATPERDPVLFEAALSFVPALEPAAVGRALAERARFLDVYVAAQESAGQTLHERHGLGRELLLEHEYRLALDRAELDYTRGLADDVQSGRLTWPRRHPSAEGST